MCGICGIAFANRGETADADLIAAMRDALAHRGPNGAGLIELRGATLGHRRLSVIDLATGGQPMANEDQTVWVSYNGEIYNYLELRSQLLARGHQFRTRSDTEVLVHAYEEFGDDFVRRLNGMFAFALYDVKRGRLLLARDHVGIKPMFYVQSADRLAFASEIKGLFPAIGRRPGLRPESLQEYLVFRYVAWDRTFYQDVRRLPPGHLAVYEQGRLSLQRYWAPPIASAPSAPTMAEAVAELDTRLARAVHDQLVSDVPLGAFCSGGVDSGLVTSYAARESQGFQTFSVGFDDPTWDETALASDTARRAGATHHVIKATADELEQLLPRLIHYHDEPLSHPNSVPLYVLSQLAVSRVTVVLTGEGADELFGGYPRYHLARARGALRFLPRWARIGAAAALRALPGHRAAKAAALLPPTLEDSLLLNSAYVDPAVVARITGSPLDAAFDARRRLVAETLRASDPIGSLSRYELLTYLPCGLDRMDRMAMAHGLEGRVPFLDVGLIEWGLALPTRFKLGLRSNKRVLKEVAARWLSPRIVHGPKSGFGLPLGAWFRGPELRHVKDRLLDAAHPAASHFDQALLRRVVREHESGTADHGELLWLVANVYLWVEGQRDAGVMSAAGRGEHVEDAPSHRRPGVGTLH
jgi:asparagine synthase (glutamine-hydrolysing)